MFASHSVRSRDSLTSGALAGLLIIATLGGVPARGQGATAHDDRTFSGCGELVREDACLIFRTDSGRLFVLEEYGGFGAGDRVRVVGRIDGDCEPVCSLLAECLIGNSVSASCPADVACSGTVDFGDVLVVLSMWGETGGRADIDGSGLVDHGDLVAVFSAWGNCPRTGR